MSEHEDNSLEDKGIFTNYTDLEGPKVESDTKLVSESVEFSPMGLTEAGVRIRDLISIASPKVDQHRVADNVVSAASVLYGRGIQGELPLKVQSGLTESINRIGGKIGQTGKVPFKLIRSGPISAADVAERLEGIHRTLSEGVDPSALQQISFDGAMAFAHLFSLPEGRLDRSVEKHVREKLIMAESLLING
jgi:hypothetical protein